MRVLITGATGFIGTHLVNQLAGTGHQIVAIARRSPAPAKSLPSVQWKHADSLLQLASQLQAWESEQIDAIVHLAAHVHVFSREAGDDAGAFRRTNVDDTLSLAQAARRAGVRRFVFMSTVKVHGDESGPDLLTEDSPLNPGDGYARSKVAAEQALQQSADGLELVVLRPPLVYGPGVGANFHRLMALVSSGWFLPFGSVRNCRSLVYVGNLVHAVDQCLRVPSAAGKTFLVSDGSDVSTPELLRRIGAAIGRPVRLVRVPPSLLQGVARLAGKQDLATRLLHSLAVDCHRIRVELGWIPPFTLEAGLTETAKWFRSHEALQHHG